MDDQQLVDSLLDKEPGFVHIRDAAAELWQRHAASEVRKLAHSLYAEPEHQKRMCAVFLLAMLAVHDPSELAFLREHVATDENWRVQEILAQAFDYYCRETGYLEALPVIEEWLAATNPNARRAVVEGLRVWTKRPYFREHPEAAIRLISAQRRADSHPLRRSAENSLRDIMRTHPQLAGNL